MRRILTTKELCAYANSINGKKICLSSRSQICEIAPNSSVFKLYFSEMNVYESTNRISLGSVSSSYVELQFVTKVTLDKARFADELYIDCYQPSSRSNKTFHLTIA